MTKAQSPIPITRPLFGPEEIAAVQRPLETGWVVQGPYVAEFEREVARFAGAEFAVASTSCTTALHLAVAALGLRPGDEVLVPAFTWVSTANVVEYMGARPVFCDINLATFNVAPASVAANITARTVGIIPVHLFGLCAEMAPIQDLAAKHSLWVVEDAACALGSRYRGQHAGTFGDAGCFSFHPRKSITTGEGGMLTTNRRDVEQTARSLRDHGASRSDFERHTGSAGFLLPEYALLGYNYRMTDLQGALGCAQMQRVDWILEQRARLARRYDELLADVPWLRPPVVPPGFNHAYQAYVTFFQPEPPNLANMTTLSALRNQLMLDLETRGIATRQGTHAPVTQSFYSQKYGLKREDFPNAVLAEQLSLTLPLYPQMTEEEQDRVIGALRDAARS